MEFIARLAEEKIRKAIDHGEFENLPGKGQPLNIEDLSRVPEDLRVGYILLKNAGVLPAEMEQKKELVNLQSLIECCKDQEERTRLKKKLNEKMLRFNLRWKKEGLERLSFATMKRKYMKNYIYMGSKSSLQKSTSS